MKVFSFLSGSARAEFDGYSDEMLLSLVEFARVQGRVAGRELHTDEVVKRAASDI